MKKSINITEEGRTALQKELAELISERPAISERIATARAFGDLSENEEYSSARAEQKRAETRILEIEDILKKCPHYPIFLQRQNHHRHHRHRRSKR